MAAAAASWQESLKANLLKPILEDFFSLKGPPEEEEIRTLTWCFGILEKPAEELTPEHLAAERVGKLVIEAFHRAIEKVATQQLRCLQLNYQIATLEELEAKDPCETKESEKDGFQIVDLKTEDAALWKKKIKLLEKWKANPSLILPKRIYTLAGVAQKSSMQKNRLAHK